MKEGGWGLVGLGTVLLGIAIFAVDVSIDIGYVPSANPYIPSMPREVANLHAMHIQSLLVHAGIGSIICGTIAIGFGTIEDRFGVLMETLSRRPRSLADQPAGEQRPRVEPATETVTDEDESDNTGVILWSVIAGIVIVFIIAAYATSSADRNAAPTLNATSMEGDANVSDVLSDADNALNDAARALEDLETP